MENSVSEILAQKGSEVFAIPPDATVAAAVRMMNERNIGAVAVVEDDRLIGIFTERDVLRRVIDGRMDPETTPLYEVMTRDLAVIKPTTTIAEALVVINSRNCRHLPVLDGERLVGMLSIRDLTNWLVDDKEHRIAELVEYISGNYGPTTFASH